MVEGLTCMKFGKLGAEMLDASLSQEERAHDSIFPLQGFLRPIAV